MSHHCLTAAIFLELRSGEFPKKLSHLKGRFNNVSKVISLADTFCHATEGGLILAGPFIRKTRKKWVLWTLGIVGAVLGALPDLIGSYGNWVEHDHYRLYVSAHRGAIEQILLYVPMYGLHVFVDTLTHGPGRRWWIWNEGLWLEILLWVINILLIYWLLRIWRKNAESSPKP